VVKEREFYKTLFKIALPVAFQSFLSVGVNMLDNIMVGYFSPEELSGVAMANQLTVFISFFIRGINGSSSLMISQYWGKGDMESIKKLFAIIVKFCFKVIFCVTAVLFLFPRGALRIFTDNGDIITYGSMFLKIVCISYLFQTLSDGLAAMLRSVEIVNITIVLTSVSFVTNLTLNYALIFGHFGFPAMGVRGAAIATVIARAAELSVALYFVLKIEKKVHFRIKDIFKKDKLLTKDFHKYGLPALIGDLQWGLIGTVRGMVIGRCGTEMMSANSITETVMSLAFAFTTGLSNAACIVTGKSIGESADGNYKKTKEYSNTIQILFSAAGFVMAATFFGARGLFASFYRGMTPEIRALAKTLLGIGAVSIAGTAYHASCFTGINRGAGDTKFVFKVDMVCGWLIVVPSMLLARFVFHLPLPVIFFTTRIDQYFKWIIALIRLRGDKWIKNVTRELKVENGELREDAV